jgi:hypothetical protein
MVLRKDTVDHTHVNPPSKAWIHERHASVMVSKARGESKSSKACLEDRCPSPKKGKKREAGDLE